MNVGYVRLSVEDKSREGVSLDAQRERVAAYGLATGKVVDTILSDEGVSAKSLERPALQQLLKECSDGKVASVIVLKLDRLTRSVRDLGDLLEHFSKADVALVSVCESLDTSTAGGRLLLNLLASVSQWEREAIAERTEFALAYKRRHRQAYSRTPFGFDRVGDTLIPNAEQQRALQMMKQMRADGATLKRIGEALQEAGVAPPRGKRWYPSSVRAVLTSKIAEDAA